MNDIPTIPVTIMTPEAVVWQGPVQALESSNSEGVFSILPDHSHFITIVSGQPITLFLPDDSTQEFTYEEAVLVVMNEAVSVYVHESPSE